MSRETTELRAEGLGYALPRSNERAGRWLFRGLDLRLEPGSVTVLVGPNGSGKTTLMRTLLGLHPPSEGSVRLGPRPLAELRARARARAIAWLPQRTELPWSMTAEQLVMLGRTPHLSVLAGPRAEDRHAVAAALARVGASELADRALQTLSGGERQRVLLARLLATDAPILLLDEPTTALDVGHALELLELTRSLAASGHALLLSLHELDQARRYGDRALLLRADEQGGHVQGEAKAVLTPARLQEVFGVGVELIGDRLGFSPLVTRDPVYAEVVNRDFAE